MKNKRSGWKIALESAMFGFFMSLPMMMVLDYDEGVIWFFYIFIIAWLYKDTK